MNVTNHMAVGAIIAVTIKEPIAVLPLAFISHFILDGLPHFGYFGRGIGDYIKHRRSHVMTVIDIIGISLLFWIVEPSWLVYSAMFLAISPDFIWLFRYYFYERKSSGTKISKPSRLTRLHSKIQWFERPVGFWVEIILAPVLLLTLANIK